VRRLREHVDWAHAPERVARLDELRGVRRKGRGVEETYTMRLGLPSWKLALPSICGRLLRVRRLVRRTLQPCANRTG